MSNTNNMGAYFSPSKNMFYLLGLKSSYESGIGWPSDAVAVTDAVFTEYGLSTPPAGKTRGVSNNAPCWIATT